ncbi:isochorismatase family protein [Photobacterium angustum]|uniref:isochorismatase family protein n=1 Tax=Photobacterium angustum TaxID=661 RepID=UPI0005E3D43E|nr:isochorismatase family protein [Photobacterium angustum]KJG02961.1 isochorismatase [Photobacterium angustum]KJG17758.1 isochorismatase [Photobacterium angustum]KJG24965.1 isochorismatase [Photobacterium angustum]KJG32906.1 isochorismatase [Photobacterium angustum]PSV65538.1 hydrolase [Photobacterium angustum]
MLDIHHSILVVIDIQGNLAQLMNKKDHFFRQAEIMVKGAELFDLPTLWLEQLPDKLGATIPQIAYPLTQQGLTPIAKESFSAVQNISFLEQLQLKQRKSIIIIGIEAHICVYQTVIDLIAEGYQVTVISDAISSRTEENKQIAINKMQRAGAQISTTEMVLFELQRVANGDRFKALLNLIK